MLQFRTIAAAFCIAWTACCCTESGDEGVPKTISISRSGPVPEEDIAGRVDGVAITLEDVQAIMAEHSEKELTPRGAVDIAIRTELLAAEARRRGYENSDHAESARRAAMARVLLENRIGEGLGPEDVPFEVVERAYEGQKERFVHGTQRKVAHILVREKKEPDSARELAEKIHRAAESVSSLEEFETVYENFASAHRKQIKLEKLPPFHEKTKKFVSEFVDAAFEVPEVGMVSNPTRTEFGVHVIYIIEELPAKSIPFEKAEAELREALLPELKKRRARKLEEELYKEGDVFIFENVLPLLEETP